MNDEKNTKIYVAFEDHEHCDLAAPERGLLRAILLTALADLKKGGDAGRRATEYLLSSEDDYLFSFVSVCEFLAVDPDRVLMVTGLKERKKRRNRRDLGGDAVNGCDSVSSLPYGKR